MADKKNDWLGDLFGTVSDIAKQGAPIFDTVKDYLKKDGVNTTVSKPATSANPVKNIVAPVAAPAPQNVTVKQDTSWMKSYVEDANKPVMAIAFGVFILAGLMFIFKR